MILFIYWLIGLVVGTYTMTKLLPSIRVSDMICLTILAWLWPMVPLWYTIKFIISLDVELWRR